MTGSYRPERPVSRQSNDPSGNTSRWPNAGGNPLQVVPTIYIATCSFGKGRSRQHEAGLLAEGRGKQIVDDQGHP